MDLNNGITVNTPLESGFGATAGSPIPRASRTTADFRLAPEMAPRVRLAERPVEV